MSADDYPDSDSRLPRRRILRGRREFTRLFTGGNGVRAGRLLVKYLPLVAERRNLKAGFIVRRSSGGAVVRNRVRRRLRESYRMERAAFEASLPDGIELHLAFLWLGNREQSERARFKEIDDEVRSALRKLSRRLRTGSDATERR